MRQPINQQAGFNKKVGDTIKFRFLNFENDLILSQDSVAVLEIHNKTVFRRIVDSIINSSGKEDPFEPYIILNGEQEISPKSVECITDIINYDLNSKEILKSIFERAKNYYVINADEYLKVNEASVSLLDVLQELLDEYECDVSFNSDGFDIQKLLKFFNFSVETNGSDWYNKLVSIISVYGDLFPNKILCFVNMKQWMNREETENIFKHITSQKVTTLFLESVECTSIYKYEKKLVIDSDFYEFVC